MRAPARRALLANHDPLLRAARKCGVAHAAVAQGHGHLVIARDREGLHDAAAVIHALAQRQARADDVALVRAAPKGVLSPVGAAAKVRALNAAALEFVRAAKALRTVHVEAQVAAEAARAHVELVVLDRVHDHALCLVRHGRSVEAESRWEWGQEGGDAAKSRVRDADERFVWDESAEPAGARVPDAENYGLRKRRLGPWPIGESANRRVKTDLSDRLPGR